MSLPLIQVMLPRCLYFSTTVSVIAEGKVRRLAQSTVEKLDSADREQRRQAQWEGHTHPVAQGPAMRRDGSIAGRVTR